MDYNLEYYIVSRSNRDSYPILLNDAGCPPYQYAEGYIQDPQVMSFCLGNPIPKKPTMGDYHPTPHTVVSDKIKDILESMNISGIQFIPAIVTGKENELYENYWFLNIYQLYPALDKKKSIFRWNSTLKLANPIRKIVLNNEILDKITLDKRLIFRLKENEVKQFYHQSVVDAIMATNPEGIRFTKVSDWTVGSAFD